MTVNDLIEILTQVNGDLELKFSDDRYNREISNVSIYVDTDGDPKLELD